MDLRQATEVLGPDADDRGRLLRHKGKGSAARRRSSSQGDDPLRAGPRTDRARTRWTLDGGCDARSCGGGTAPRGDPSQRADAERRRPAAPGCTRPDRPSGPPEENAGIASVRSLAAQLDQGVQEFFDATHVHRLEIVDGAVHHDDLDVWWQVAGKLVPQLLRPEGPVTDPVERGEALARVRDGALRPAALLLGRKGEQVVELCAHRSGSRRGGRCFRSSSGSVATVAEASSARGAVVP